MRVAAAMIVTVVLWASAFVAIRAAVVTLSPAEVAVGRFMIASAVMLMVALVRGFPRVPWRDLPRTALAGLTGITLYSLALNTGEVTATAATAGFLVNTVPLFTALLAAIFLRERLAPSAYTGIVICMVGAYVVAVSAGGLRISGGAPLLLGAAILQASFFLLQSSLLARHSPIDVTTLEIWFGTLFLAPFALGALPHFHSANAGPVIYLGIFPGVVAYFTYAFASAHVPVSQLTAFLYLVPLMTIPIAYFWLHEVPKTGSVVGGCVILLGVALVARGRRRRRAAIH